jgi:hypothetical protein
VEGDGDVVDRDLNVGLEVAVAELDRPFERRKGVLRGFARPAPVGEGDRTGPVEERVALGPWSG